MFLTHAQILRQDTKLVSGRSTVIINSSMDTESWLRRFNESCTARTLLIPRKWKIQPQQTGSRHPHLYSIVYQGKVPAGRKAIASSLGFNSFAKTASITIFKKDRVSLRQHRWVVLGASFPECNVGTPLHKAGWLGVWASWKFWLGAVHKDSSSSAAWSWKAPWMACCLMFCQVPLRSGWAGKKFCQALAALVVGNRNCKSQTCSDTGRNKMAATAGKRAVDALLSGSSVSMSPAGRSVYWVLGMPGMLRSKAPMRLWRWDRTDVKMALPGHSCTMRHARVATSVITSSPNEPTSPWDIASPAAFSTCQSASGKQRRSTAASWVEWFSSTWLKSWSLCWKPWNPWSWGNMICITAGLPGIVKAGTSWSWHSIAIWSKRLPRSDSATGLQWAFCRSVASAKNGQLLCKLWFHTALKTGKIFSSCLKCESRASWKGPVRLRSFTFLATSDRQFACTTWAAPSEVDVQKNYGMKQLRGAKRRE